MKNMINKVVSSKEGVDTLPIRIAVGLVLAAHGAQKLFAWFGGYGLEGTAGWMESIGLAPGMLMATLAGSAEFFGGLLLVIGLLVRPAALVVAVTMLVAMFTVHISNGLFMSNNGYEYALTLLVVAVGLAIRGAGSFSIDRLIQVR
jgi:putative oxidoreductase